MANAVISGTAPPKAASEVTFSRQVGGYDRQQVDRYIGSLAAAYQAAFDKCSAVCAKYDKLLEDYNILLQQSENDKMNSSALTRTLVDAEVMAESIISKARAEADRIIGDACIEKLAAKRSIEASDEHLRQTISKLQSLLST